jgi:four helix bundle protein
MSKRRGAEPVAFVSEPAVEYGGRSALRFERLTVWQAARTFASDIYTATEDFPKAEIFGLTSQLRRAAVSIAANIAEGSGRNSDADFAHFLEIAYGSAMEAAALVFIAADTGKLNEQTRDNLLNAVSALTAQLTALNRSLSLTRSKTPFPRRAS